MAPVRIRKRKSSTPATTDKALTTPDSSAAAKPVKITVGQKQALIDNLQLEITERARKLRAQYTLQAQSLRNRVELRVNRIPTSFRKAKLGELIAKQTESKRNDQIESSTEFIDALSSQKNVTGKNIAQEKKTGSLVSDALNRSVKRKSDDMVAITKEQSGSDQQISNANKRTKMTETSPTRQLTSSTILSPKSPNSCKLPQSPIRPQIGSPQKSYLSRPVSPLKSVVQAKLASPAKAGVLTATASLVNLVNDKLKSGPTKNAIRKTSGRKVPEANTAVTRPKRGAANMPILRETRTVSNTSNTSGASTGTTLVKHTGRKPAAATTTAAAKKAVGVNAASKKVAATKVEPPAPGRRVLRKRI